MSDESEPAGESGAEADEEEERQALRREALLAKVRELNKQSLTWPR